MINLSNLMSRWILVVLGQLALQNVSYQLSETKSKTDQMGFCDDPKSYVHSDGTENDEK